MTVAPIEAATALAPLNMAPLDLAATGHVTAANPARGLSFEQLLNDGVNAVDGKLKAADELAAAFAVDDSIPVHQVMFAMEEARLSLELLLQVRSRLVEGYQEIMRMQL